MAVIKPFRAWRPRAQFAEHVACVPYDVISTEEARSLAENKEHSFLHVIRPEIDLSSEISVYDDRVYEKGKENLQQLLQSDVYEQDEKPCLYIYRMVMNGRSQSGIFSCVSAEDYNNNIILKHELTRPDKEDDRTRHILTQQAHAEPVMLTFKDTGTVTAFMDGFMQSHAPLFDFIAKDGVQHSIWQIEDTHALENAFSQIPELYVADGHHRCASAARAAAAMAQKNENHTGNEAYNFFPAVLFPMNQMEILAYNRIIYKVEADFMNTLREQFAITENANPVPKKRGDVAFYVGKSWFGISLNETENTDAASQLDVSKLQRQILEPIFGITNQRTDSNIDFVGGIRGSRELENLVDSGTAQLAISLYPTSVQELMEVSDAGQLMPPKSTWFEPKIRSGLLVHTF